MRVCKRKISGKRWITAGILALVTVFLVGIISTVYAADEGSKKILKFGETGSFMIQKGLDPQTSLGGRSVVINYSLFEGLARKEVGTGEIKPCLATSWKIAPNWSSVDFFIRKGIKFHNGDPLTAEDVKFSFERTMKEDLGNVLRGEMTRSIDSIKVVGTYQVNIKLKEPWPAILDRCAVGILIVPMNYIKKVGDQKFADNPVGTGPFKIISFKPDDYVHMAAVKDHWRQAPNYDELRVIVIKEASTRFSMLKTGELDLTWTGPAFLAAVAKEPTLKNIVAPHCYLHTIVFYDLIDRNNPKGPKYKSPWQDPRVRQAASLAINREGICKLIPGLISPWGNFLAPYHAGYQKREIPRYDPEAAKKLLCEVAGVKYPVKAPYPWEGWDWGDLTWGPEVRLAFEPIMAQLLEVGIKMKANEMEAGIWAKKHTEGELRGLGYGPGPWWGGYSHPAASFESHTIGTWAPVGRTYPEFKTAFEKMVQAPNNKALAKAAREMEDLMFKVGYRTPLWEVNNIYALGPKVEWFQTIPGSNYLFSFEYLKYKK